MSTEREDLFVQTADLSHLAHSACTSFTLFSTALTFSKKAAV